MLSSHSGKKNPLWVYPQEDPECKEGIIKEFKIHPVTAQILISRGFRTFEQVHKHLYAKLPDLLDPFLLAEMPQAVERICTAIHNGENILIYGDNDVDGMTGTALLTDFFDYVGANVHYYVSSPSASRKSIIVEALEYALQNQCKLLITVDCGITAAAEIAQVVKEHVDVIITDHHEPTEKIPHCIATLNPKLLNSTYPNRELTGVGVAFKFAHAITKQLVADGKISPKKVDLKRYLDLVALGTISDMGQLLGENRILVRYGLRQLRRTKRVGLAKLINVCNLELSDLNTFTIATKVAPRLNSLGRIADPQKGVKMLLIRNPPEAEKMAQELDLNNIERQRIERVVSTEVDQMLQTNPEILTAKAIIMASEKWHPGVIAIVTTRLAKQYNRPTILISIENNLGKGSLRSIPQFPLLDVLKECSDILINYGGHDFAAGISIHAKHIDEFRKRFTAAAERKLIEDDVTAKLALDAEVKFDELTFDFMESLRLLEPYGNGNPPPILYSDAKQAWFPKIISKSHLKLYLEQGDQIFEGVALGKAYLAPLLKKKGLKLRVAFTPQISQDSENKTSIQLIIRDFHILEPVQDG